MPVEIRELIIRAVVDDANDKRGSKPDQERQPAADQEAIIEECVRQVLKILKKSKER